MNKYIKLSILVSIIILHTSNGYSKAKVDYNKNLYAYKLSQLYLGHEPLNSSKEFKVLVSKSALNIWQHTLP